MNQLKILILACLLLTVNLQGPLAQEQEMAEEDFSAYERELKELEARAEQVTTLAQEQNQASKELVKDSVSTTLAAPKKESDKAESAPKISIKRRVRSR